MTHDFIRFSEISKFIKIELHKEKEFRVLKKKTITKTYVGSDLNKGVRANTLTVIVSLLDATEFSLIKSILATKENQLGLPDFYSNTEEKRILKSLFGYYNNGSWLLSFLPGFIFLLESSFGRIAKEHNIKWTDNKGKVTKKIGFLNQYKQLQKHFKLKLADDTLDKKNKYPAALSSLNNIRNCFHSGSFINTQEFEFPIRKDKKWSIVKKGANFKIKPLDFHYTIYTCIKEEILPLYDSCGPELIPVN